MAEISTLFWDVGGVLLTNGWERKSRQQAMEKFKLDWEDFQDRHDLVISDFETGRIHLEDYLRCTVFYRDRPFTKDEFKDFMFAQSKPNPETLAILKQLVQTKRYFLATLNNESLELNLYRIKQFGLRDHFNLFLSSCFLGARKPDCSFFKVALQLTQRDPTNCVFIDDRALNLECAGNLGIKTIHYQNPEQLRQGLESVGVNLK